MRTRIGGVKVKVDFSRLQKIIADDDSKGKIANNTSICLDEYMNYITNYLLKCKELNEEELAMLVISEQNWLLRRDFFTSKATVDIGDIFYADLGKNYKPECSYGHPVLVMEIIGNMIFVVPVSSSKDKIKEAYHPINNKDGNKNLRKVTIEEGFNSECSLLLSNARTISGGRLLEKKENIFNSDKGKELFEEIKNTMLATKTVPIFDFLMVSPHLDMRSVSFNINSIIWCTVVNGFISLIFFSIVISSS